MDFEDFIERYAHFGDTQALRSGQVLTDELAYEVLSVVEEIPRGKVASYGQIARLVGRPKNARLVGTILKRAEFYGSYPCHRVINAAGRLVPGWDEQAALLAEEGVELGAGGTVDMQAFQWDA